MSDIRPWEAIPLQEERAHLESLISTPKPTRSLDLINAAEEQISASIKDVRYIVREYPASVIVSKYLVGISQDENELFVPDYQRELIWPDKIQCRFIESVLIGLPIPFLFVADISDKEDPSTEGRLEIVDGVQRIRTLARFMTGGLVLTDLERLTKLSGFTFFDLTPSRQKRFSRATLRLIELTESVSEDVRRDMFDRVNTGSVGLEAVEVRRGINKGPFLDLISELSKDAALRVLAPISEAMEKRYEYEELVTRFFAFLNTYEQYGSGPEGKVVKAVLNRYVDDTNNLLRTEPSVALAMEQELKNVLEFALRYFPDGFKKIGKGRKVPRVRFEALAVGTGLALRQNPNLAPKHVAAWINSTEFQQWTTSDASNNKFNLQGRINYVRDKLLND